MSLFSLAPSSVDYSIGAWNVLGTLPGAMGDGSDATYIQKNSNAASRYRFNLADLSLPANEVIRGARWSCRMSRPSVNSRLTIYFGYAGGSSYSGSTSGLTKTYTGPWLYTNAVTGLSWTLADINALLIEVLDNAASFSAATKFYELGMDIDTASIPVAPTVTAPTGTTTDTTTPSIAWTHNDQVTATVSNRASSGTTRTITTSAAHGFLVGNDVTVSIGNANYDTTAKITAVTSTTFTYTFGSSLTEGTTAASGTATIGESASQAAYQVRVFTAAQYGAGGFDPATSAATWDSGQVTSSTSSATPAALANATYRAYVRTAKSVNGTLVWGPYAFSGFTVTVTPAVVTLSASFDSPNNRVQLTIAGAGNLLSAQDANLETAASTGSWAANANCSVTQSTTFADAGTGSLRLSSTAAGTMSARTASGLAAIPVLPSTAYSATARVRAGASARTCTLAIQWYDATGAALTTATGTGVADATGTWTTITVTGTSPAGAAFAAVVVTVASTAAAAELHYVDSIALHPGSSPAYSPGGLTYSLVLTRTPTGGAATSVRPPLTLDLAQKATIYDYDAPRGVLSTWSATLVGKSALGSVSSIAVTATATPTNDGTWWLKSVANPTLNRGSVRVLSAPNEAREETAGVFRLDGRTDPVVVSGQTFGDDISFTVYTSTAAEFEAVKALAVHQGTLLLQEPFTDSAGIGLQRFIRILDRSWTKEGTPGAPRRVFTLRAIEVGRGY